uniref:(California timema) hypothetical protein n=1 Tax=Timema californicum TaxID=61474 RepID=A0A7R9PFL5_TIMCA|nr:unnamed protein product [Timema californicum]
MISSLLNMSTEETNSGADTAKNSFLPLVQDLSPEKIKDSQESILTWLRQPQVTPSLVPNTGARVVDVAQDGGLTDTPNIGARVVDVAQDGGLTLVPNIGARAVDVAQDGGLTDTPNTGVRVVDVAQDGGLTLVPNTGARVVDVAQDGGLTDTPNTGVRVVDVAQDGGLTLVPNIGARVVDVAQDGGLTLIPNSGARVVDVAQDGGLTLIPNSGARVVDVAQDGGLTLVPNSGARVVNVTQDGGLTLVTNSGARVVDVAQDGGLTLVPNSGARVVDVAQDGGLTLIPNTGVRVVDVAQDGGLTDTPNTGVRAAPLYDVAPCLLSRQASDISDDCCQPKKSLHNSYVTPMKSSHNVSTTQSLPRGGKTALHDLTNNLPFSKSMPAMVSGQNSQDRRPTTCHQQSDNKENEMNTTATRMSESTPLKNGQYVSEGNSMSAQLKVYSKSSHLRLPLGTHMPRSGALMEQVVNKDLRVPFRVAEPGPTRGVVNTMSVIQEVYCVKQQTITSSPILADTFRPCTKDVGVQCSAQTADAVTMTDTPHGKDKDVLCVNGRRYTTLNKLGLGGSCVVYQVRDHESSSVLAVKCVSLPVHDKMLAQGYLNEVSMIRRLQGSECVIKLIDS